MPITIDNSAVESVTIDGTEVQEITMDGDVVYRAVEIVDDFEDGNANGWTVQGTGNRSFVGGLDGTSTAWEHNGFTEAHLAGADAVDRGPQPGDIFEFWFEITNTSGSVINRFEFSADGLNEPDVYRIEFENGTGADEFSLEKIQGGGQALVDTDAGFTANVGQVYRCEIGWNASGNDITAQLFLPNGNTATNQLLINDSSSGDFSQPGIFIRTNDNNACTWDEIKIP